MSCQATYITRVKSFNFRIQNNRADHRVMASSNSNQMDVDRQEEELYNFNDEEITSWAVELQNKLSQLKLQVIEGMARNKAMKANNKTIQLDDEGELFGEGAEKVTNELHKITKERTQTFLKFTSLSVARKAAEANKAIIRAFNLENGGNINLEKEEEEYLRSLLDEQKELIRDVVGQHKEGSKQEVESIETRIKLAELYSR